MDSPYFMTTKYMQEVFNPNNPDHPDVLYLSYGGTRKMDLGNIYLWLSHNIIQEREGPNDGLVSIWSSKWGNYLRTLDADHAEMIGWGRFQHLNLYREILNELANRGL